MLRRITLRRSSASRPTTLRGLIVMPDGEIRHYGFRRDGSKSPDTQPVYISSRECGLSWHEVPSRSDRRAMVRSPWSGDFLTVLCKPLGQQRGMADGLNGCDGSGLFVFRSAQGPEGH